MKNYDKIYIYDKIYGALAHFDKKLDTMIAFEEKKLSELHAMRSAIDSIRDQVSDDSSAFCSKCLEDKEQEQEQIDSIAQCDSCGEYYHDLDELSSYADNHGADSDGHRGVKTTFYNCSKCNSGSITFKN